MELKDAVKLAVEIADESCITTIECNLTAVRDKIGRILWWDVLSADEWAQFDVMRAVRYLKIRGRLRVNRKVPTYVKPMEAWHA